MDMVTLGADLHKRWHTVVAVDGTGRKLAEKTVRANPDGHLGIALLPPFAGEAVPGLGLDAVARGDERRPQRSWAISPW